MDGSTSPPVRVALESANAQNKRDEAALSIWIAADLVPAYGEREDMNKLTHEQIVIQHGSEFVKQNWDRARKDQEYIEVIAEARIFVPASGPGPVARFASNLRAVWEHILAEDREAILAVWRKAMTAEPCAPAFAFQDDARSPEPIREGIRSHSIRGFWKQ